MPTPPDHASKPTSRNLESAEPGCLQWNCADTAASLHDLLTYVESEATKAAGWYLKNKRGKAFLSRGIQFLAVILTSAAAIVPIIGQIVDKDHPPSSLWASLLVGLAAALLALDKAFGFSSGWARYVMAATNIRKSLEEFRMDWQALSAKACPNPAPDQIDALVQRAKQLRVDVSGVVQQETKDWVTEFQNNMAQLEKDVTAQLSAMKEQNEKTAQARLPGSIQLTVSNADKADDATVQVKLESASGVVTDEAMSGSKTWARPNVDPGQYQLTASAKAGGKPVSGTTVVIVKPGEIAQAQIALPI